MLATGGVEAGDAGTTGLEPTARLWEVGTGVELGTTGNEETGVGVLKTEGVVTLEIGAEETRLEMGAEGARLETDVEDTILKVGVEETKPEIGAEETTMLADSLALDRERETEEGGMGREPGALAGVEITKFPLPEGWAGVEGMVGADRLAPLGSALKPEVIERLSRS